jgi:hypothetical protein
LAVLAPILYFESSATTAEEAGVLIGLRGLLGFDHSSADGSRQKLRFAFVGYPGILGEPKRVPDHQ